MPLIGYQAEGAVPRERKKLALTTIDGPVQDWIEDHGHLYPLIRDLCHQITVHVEKEKEKL